jgi:hypothetical protein
MINTWFNFAGALSDLVSLAIADYGELLNHPGSLAASAGQVLAWLGAATIFVFGYAEIHFRVPFVPSRLFKKEPEIVFDLPHRGKIDQQIPLFLFIKDAERFPIILEQLTIEITPRNTAESIRLETDLNQQIRSKFFSWTFQIPAHHFPKAGHYRVTAELTFQGPKKQAKIRQDNYRGIPHDPFSIYISDEPLPTLPNCHWGDLHIHSNYTDDQVEFGAPIRETAQCARALGLEFIAITDHSYDLDDKVDNYLENDPYLKKWQNFIKEAERTDTYFTDMVVLGGEEVSAGNHRNENVHCLILGNNSFYHGTGDGGELLFYNLPTLSLERLFNEIGDSQESVIIAAAHPFDKPPYTQKKLLNRGYWQQADLSHKELDYWQIFNGRRDKYFQQGLEEWKKALLSGQRIGILGGTDAHGNFNCYRQISIPFLSMIKHNEQLLGQTRTGVFSEKPLNRATLLGALKKKRVIVSNGPAGAISIQQKEKIYHIGDEAKARIPLTLRITAGSSREFGPLSTIDLYFGSIKEKKERRESISLKPGSYKLEKEMEMAEGLTAGYVRAEVKTEKNICLTNPIWIV